MDNKSFQKNNSVGIALSANLFIKDNKITRVNYLSNVLFLASLAGFLFLFYLTYQRYNPNLLAFNIQNTEFSKNYSSAKKSDPAALEIDSVNILLPVIPAETKADHWQVTDRGVSYLKSSAIPGETGNSILYGHNWPNLLGNLKNVKTGEKIKITMADGTNREFIIEYTSEVKPSDVDVIKNSKDARLTLYTCSGFLDSKRFVVVAKPLV